MSTRIAMRQILAGLLGAILTITVIFNILQLRAGGYGSIPVAFAAANAPSPESPRAGLRPDARGPPPVEAEHSEATDGLSRLH